MLCMYVCMYGKRRTFETLSIPSPPFSPGICGAFDNFYSPGLGYLIQRKFSKCYYFFSLLFLYFSFAYLKLCVRHQCKTLNQQRSDSANALTDCSLSLVVTDGQTKKYGHEIPDELECQLLHSLLNFVTLWRCIAFLCQPGSVSKGGRKAGAQEKNKQAVVYL